VTLRNMSTSSTLAISNIGIAGNANADYQITTSTCGITLAGGASCTVEVTFNPTKKGNRKASLTVTHYEDGSPHAVSLDGSGK
jgi:secreted trypsin-like serine protease